MDTVEMDAVEQGSLGGRGKGKGVDKESGDVSPTKGASGSGQCVNILFKVIRSETR